MREKAGQMKKEETGERDDGEERRRDREKVRWCVRDN